MKRRRNIKTRLCSMMLIVCMMFGLFSMPTIAFATGTQSVSVEWTPQRQTISGQRQVNLTASLTQSDGTPAAELIDIHLEKAETEALQWDGDFIDESALGLTEPESGDNGSDEGDEPTSPSEPESSDNGDGSAPITDLNAPAGGEAGQDESPAASQPSAAPTAPTGGADAETSAVLIAKNDGGAVLRILLSGAKFYEKTLTFIDVNSSNLTINIADEDIKVQTYEDGAPTSITAVDLLEDGNDDALITTSAFTVFAHIPEEIAVSTTLETVDLGSEGSKDITYSINLQKIAAGEGGKDYTFTVKLPVGLSLPAGEISYDNGSITCGETEIAKLEYPSDAAGSFSVSEGSLNRTNDGFVFTVAAPYDTDATENEVYVITLTLRADKFARSAEAISGEVTLAVSEAGGKTASDTVTITAGDATLPGEGGWEVTATETKDQNQAVFWRDNEEQNARPEGWSDRNFWKTQVKLYYTLTDKNGVTYERTLLTEDALAKVGLETYPTFVPYGAHGFTVKDLPSVIQQTDPNNPNSVVNTYEVSWSLEPPDGVDGYDFRNITQSEVGEDHTYPSIDTPGWYYMQQDTFTFTLDIRQGDENPLDENREDKLRALLENFQFNWTYNSSTGNDSIIDMIDAFHATPSYDEGKITITGMWKYNVDGSPIHYNVTESSGEGSTPDRQITAAELGETDLLGDNEWYQIQYVNTGVPGEGQDTAALHSGGTLQLVRQGNTQYEATKIWLDSYGDAENSGRPHANFTLYRYRKGEDPGTAAPVNGYNITLTEKKDEGGDETGHYDIKVMTDDENATLADLPKYDTLDGAEFIYVIRETLTGVHADQYEQVFGTVTVDTEGNINQEIDSLPNGALPDGNTNRPDGNTYLYNNGTLTNYQKDTIPVTATKTWSAAAYQSTFDNVAVELTLQYREKDSGGSGEWKTYKNSEGEPVVRYLHRFYAESLSDTLVDHPSMPLYQTSTQDTTNKELEYRWLETAVYTDAANATETDLGNATGKITIDYPEGENANTGNNPIGSFEMNGSKYTVSQTGTNNTQIINSVSEYLNYKVIKEWHKGSTPGQITIQILRSVAGEDFTDYLEFTMKAEEGDETVTVTGPKTLPDSVSEDFQIEGGPATTTGSGDDPVVTWNALVSGLPRFDDRGRPYEYLLLEKGNFPVYETEIDESGNYTTTVINGGGDSGFNLLARKVWLDDGDMEHRDPVTLTLYNKNNNQPITKSGGGNYTITLGGPGEENLWHKVVWIGTSELGNTDAKGDDGKFDENDVYLVETEVGEKLVDHHLETVGNVSSPPYEYLYRERKDGEPVFEVTTDNHRYQVTYKREDATSSEDPAAKGVGVAFTITNRRLGSIDLGVTKDWVDGRAGDSSQVLEQIKAVLEEYANNDTNPTYLALAFRLVFDDSMEKTEEDDQSDEWNITYSGPSVHSDTVCVGGEDVQIYSTYQKDSQKSEGYKDTGSSEWIILGYVKDDEGNWKFTTDNSAKFLGLPKYDTNGEVVAYSIEEVWLDVTNAGMNDDGTITAPTVVDFTEDTDRNQYSELYALWQDFSADYQWGEYDADVDGAHTRDEQTLNVTNARRGSKTVQWTVEWQDDFTHNSNLRPDIYLDIYQVTYTYDENDHVTPVISRVTGRTLDWDMEKPGEWTATMSGVPAFDAKGNEIFYYAVQRTVMNAGDYDYQVAQYEIGSTALGTRDEPKEGLATLNAENTSITDANGQPYNLVVLGTRDGDREDTLGSIQWGNGQPSGIGAFGTSNNYPKYALLEGGTIINTLAETYTIEGVKYWTNLPTGWEETRLPQVTFTVSRHTDKEDDAEEVAKVVISSDQWKELKSGTQYRYLIAYEGINVLGKNDAGEIDVAEVYDMATGERIAIPTPLPRYQSGTGALWTYTVEETVNWEEGSKPDDGHQIFDASDGTGFTFTNNYNPTEGSIQVKKFLYLPGEKAADGTFIPSAYPAVTFRLERWLQKADGSNYVKDTSFNSNQQTITLTSAQVQRIWENTDTSVVEGAILDSGKSTSGDAYIWATLEFDDLPLYAPDGTRYQYSVSEVKTWLNDYDTWGVKGDVSNPSEFTEPNKNITSINELEPEKVAENETPTVDATFKNQRAKEPQVYNQFIATKIWEDNNSSFRPTTADFEKLLILTRTAKAQGGTGGAAGIEETLKPDEDYTISITPVAENSGTWTITITPADGKSFEKYAPNGMEWTYTLKERVTEEGRLQITEEGDKDQDKIYTPSTPNGKANGAWQHTITSKTKPVSGNPDTYSFGSLTNSTLTLAKFEKAWVDEENEPIPQDYLGFDLTVNLQLQVREMNSNEPWVDANEWTSDGGKTLGLAAGADVHALTGRVVGADHNWTYTFEKLPGVVQDTDNGYIFLEYRVVETKVSWGNGEDQSQTIDLPEDSTENSFPYQVNHSNRLVTNATFLRRSNTSTTTNKLATTSVSVTKAWDDNDNRYGTRPGADGPWSWASWFVLQRTAVTNPSESNWENVAVFEKLYGNNAESGGATDPGNWEDTITGLPIMDYSGTTAQRYTYRVRELQPLNAGESYSLVTEEGDAAVTAAIVPEDGTYNPNGIHYTTIYGAPADGSTLWTVTNSMDTPDPDGGVPRNVRVEKAWVGTDANSNVAEVTFYLEYSYTDTNGNTVWDEAKFLEDNQWQKTATKDNGWKVSWEALPDTDGSGKHITGYQVVEKTGSGWVQLGVHNTHNNDTTIYTFTNSISTSYSVEKVWRPDTAATHEVTLGLYRTTDTKKVGSTTSGTPVPQDELDSTKGVRKVTLGESTWTHTFTNLPKYNTSGQTYYYYVLELDGSGNPIAQNGTITLGTEPNQVSYEVSYDWTTYATKTTVTNTTAISLDGTKTWKDNGNAYGTRPAAADMKLILERKVENGTWVDVSALYTPTWDTTTHAATNQWTYRYDGLPTHNSTGQAYTYRVREYPVPDGYALENQKTNGTAGEVNTTNGNYDFTNVLSGKVTITGQKFWSGGVGSTIPALMLERRLSGSADTWQSVTVDGTTVTLTWNTDASPWTFTYTGLDKYNSNGVLYEYRVREKEPDGYEAGYKTETIDSHPGTSVDGLIITNYKDGSLKVNKTVSGNRSDPKKDFHFTVTLTGTSSAGTAATSISGSFIIHKTDAQGNSTQGTLQFTGGVSDEFTLKHKESLTIEDLPAGIGYEVTEKEANQDGYSTSGTGWTGTIPAGDTAKAEFNNYSHSSSGGDDGRTDITGQKTWVDKGPNDPKRPSSIILELYRKIEGGTEERVYATPTWIKTGNTWTYTFHALPKEDENGNTYIYRVSEVVPEGYESSQSGNKITNHSSETESGSLQVNKQVTGSGGDPTREFTFIVTLSNTSLTGTYGQMVFVNGVATFTLWDGESLWADNLPEGITYTVTEKESNQDGYTTTATGDAGIILADTTALVDFVNNRPGPEPVPNPDPNPDTDTNPNPDPAPNPNPDPNSNPNPTPNPDTDTNLSDTLGGSEVPTGDQGNLALYGVLTVLFAAGLAAVLYLGRYPRQPKGKK